MQKIDHRVGTRSVLYTLKNMMSRMSELAGLSNRYTNHGLRATACTRMFNAGVPQKVIAEFSGHKSAKALQKYEHTSPSLLRAAGLAIKDEKTVKLDPEKMEENCDNKENIFDNVKKVEDVKKALQTWNVQNCTINIQL